MSTSLHFIKPGMGVEPVIHQFNIGLGNWTLDEVCGRDVRLARD